VCVCVCIFIYIHFVCEYSQRSRLIFYVCVHPCVCARACMCVCVCGCVCVRVCVYAQVSLRMHGQKEDPKRVKYWFLLVTNFSSRRALMVVYVCVSVCVYFSNGFTVFLFVCAYWCLGLCF